MALVLLGCGALLLPPAAAAAAGDAGAAAGDRRTGVFPFYPYAARYDVWDLTPMDQGGRLVQMQVIGSERDEDIVRAVRSPAFFAPWGDPIVWDSLEKTALEKSVWLNRWYFLPSLARRYYVTRDRTCLSEIMTFVRQWRDDNPASKDASGYIPSRRRNWRDMQVAWRVQNLAWCYFLGADGFTSGEKRELYDLIDIHAQVLMADFGAQPLIENNHQSHGATNMLYAALLFPEIRNAAAIRDRARAILEHHLAKAFYDDGNSIELCPGYYPFFVSIFRDAYMLCRANQVGPPAGSEKRLQQFYHYLRTVVQPDGTMPPINDSSETGAVVSAQVLSGLLDQPLSGLLPASHWFSASHQAVMRDPSVTAPAYVFLDAGPHVAYHWHSGKLGFHLWYWDRPLLVDSGVSNYDDPLRDSWYIQPNAHNTLLVDGAGDYERGKTPLAARPSAGSRIAHWESNEKYDWAVMVHTGFQNRGKPVTWTRHFVLLKGIGCLISDRLESAGEHDYTWLFHFPPCSPEVNETSGSVFTSFAEKNLLLQPASAPAPQLELSGGTINRRSENFQAPVATYRVRAANCVRTYALLPVRVGTRPDARVEQDVVGNRVKVRISALSVSARIEISTPEQPGQSDYKLQFQLGR